MLQKKKILGTEARLHVPLLILAGYCTQPQVAEAMLEAAASVGVRGETFIASPADGGAYVVSAEPKFSDGAIRYPGDV